MTLTQALADLVSAGTLGTGEASGLLALHEAALAEAGKRKYLHVVFDVTGLPQHEIDAVAGEAMVQGECSDEYTEDEPGTGHRDVPAVASFEVEL